MTHRLSSGDEASAKATSHKLRRLLSCTDGALGENANPTLRHPRA
ncbi:hypothetical protein [Rhizobium bangladeshense]|nr:hypothetical protein [Rhizobium bangladeshense]